MYITQKINHVLGNVNEEQRDDGIELSVLGKHVQEVALHEVDGLVRQVVRYCKGRVARSWVGLIRPFGYKRLQGMFMQRGCVVRQEVVGKNGAVVQLVGCYVVACTYVLDCAFQWMKMKYRRTEVSDITCQST